MQGYYHGSISREEAEFRLQQQGASEGLFLVRLKDAAKCTFALSVCHQLAIEHHILQVWSLTLKPSACSSYSHIAACSPVRWAIDNRSLECE